MYSEPPAPPAPLAPSEMEAAEKKIRKLTSEVRQIERALSLQAKTEQKAREASFTWSLNPNREKIETRLHLQSLAITRMGDLREEKEELEGRLIAGLRRRVDAAEAEAEAAKAELQAVREGLAGGLMHEKGPDSAEALAKALGY
mmetsp:Transcript_13817/g.44427  ORF Transcript_13817/g.44427 Transcript_13817/m.44427 type:complete len:144 (+) Transcript_13817:3-434(+)